MKLHLPTRLRAAVLACITAVAALATTVGTGVVTVGTATYVLSSAQAQAIEYSGSIYTLTANSGNVSAGPYTLTTYDSTGDTFTLTATQTTGWTSGALSVNSLIGNVSQDIAHHTLRFTGGSYTGRAVTYDFSPLRVGGFVVDSGATGYSIVAGGSSAASARLLELGNSNGTACYSSINEDFSVLLGWSTSNASHVTIKGTQTWNVASGKTFTLQPGSNAACVVQSANNMNLTITGGGTARLSGKTVLDSSASITLTGGSALDIVGTLSLDLSTLTTASTPIINGEGCAVSATGLTLNNYQTLDAGSYKLISTTNDAAATLASLFESTDRYKVENKSGVVTLTVTGGSAIPVSADVNVAYTAAAQTDGYLVLNGGNLKINDGSGNAGGAAAGATTNIGSVTVQEGGTLTVWAWQQSKKDLATDNKVNIASDITLQDGGKIFIHDGSYNFTGTLAVSGSGLFESQYAKGYTFSTLSGASDAVLTIQMDDHDSNSATLVNILNANADFAGTVNLKNVHAAANPVALDLVLSHENALSNAKVSFDAASTAANNLVLNTASASVVALSGTGNIISSSEVSGNGVTAGSVTAATLTVTNAAGAFAGSISENISMIIAGGNQELGAVAVGGQLTVNAGASLTLNGALDLHSAIVNNGTVTLGDNVKFDLAHLTKSAEGVYSLITGTAVDLTSLTSDNLLNKEDGYSYSFGADGTVTAVLTSAELVWNGGNGTWDDSTENWLNGAQAAHFSTADKVRFATADAVVTVSGDKSALGVLIDADTTWTGNATVTTTTISGGATLTLDSGISLAVSESAAGAKLGGSGTFILPAASGTLGATLASTWTGTVALNRGSNTVLTINDMNLNNYAAGGNGASTVELTAMGGYWLNQTVTFTPNLVLKNSPDGSKAALELTNGYKVPVYTFAGDISGSGNWVVNMISNGPLQNYVFEGDLSAWTGKFSRLSSQNLNLTFNGKSGNTGLSELELAGNGGMTTISGTADVSVGKLTMKGSNLTLNTNLTSRGEFKFADGANSAGKTLTIADGKSLTAASLANQWGANLSLGAGSALIVNGVAAFSPGGTQRTWEGAGAGSSFVRVGGLTNNNHGNTVLRGLTLEIGASGIAQTNTGGRFVFDGITVAAAADWSATSANATSGFLELANGVTMATGTHNVTIGSKVTGEGSLTKTGEGKLTLSGTNDFSGGTTIEAGEIVASAAGAFGAGAVEVNAGATADMTVGGALASDATLTNAGTVILRTALTQGTIDNNGTIEIASGYADLEGAGIEGIEGVSAAGNGFTTGGTATVLNGGTVTGTKKVVFGTETLDIQENGKVELGSDWGTYHVNAALAETETFGAMKGAASDHSVDIEGIDVAVADQTLKVDAAGFATSMLTGTQASTAKIAISDGVTVVVDTATLPTMQLAEEGAATLELHNSASATLGNITGGSTLNVTGTASADTLTFNNGNINRTLNITNATVAAGNSGGTGFNTQATNVNAGGVLRLAGGDSLGWGNNAAGLITLAGSAEKVATLELGARQTLKTNIAMSGNSVITAINPEDHSTPMLDSYGSTLTVTGTNNTITTGFRQRSDMEFAVQEGATLVFDGSVLAVETTETAGTISKTGAGVMTFRNASGTLRKFKAAAGEVVLDNTTFDVADNLDLSDSGNATGVMKLQSGSALNFANGVNLWMNGNTSVALDETSSVNFTREDWNMSITGAAEGTPATIAGTRNAYYDFNDACVISNAAVTVTANAEKTLSTKLVNVDLVNAGSGTLTVSHADNTAFSSVNAQGGSITLNAATSIGSLTIAAGKTVTASAESPLSITSALTAGAGATLSTALSIGNGAALDLVTGDDALSLGSKAVTLGTGLTITETMMSAITSLEAEASLTLIKGVSSLTGGDVSATDVISGLTGDYTIKVENGNLVVSAAALPAAELTWLGGNGTWGGESTPWTSEGGSSAYVEGANVTIGGAGGAEGGTITVSGAQTAKNVTVAESDYVITKDTTGSLSISGNLTVNEDVEAAFAFLPTVNGNIVLNDGSTLDMTGAGNQLSSALFPTLEKTQGTGTLKLAGGANFNDNVANRVSIGNGEKTIGTKLDITENVAFNGWVKDWTDFTGSVTVSSDLSVGKEIRMETGAKLIVVDGGSLTAETLGLGHSTAGNQGAFEMTGGKTTVTKIALNGGDTTANKLTVSGGTLTITGANAFEGTGKATEVQIGAATLTNGTTDMAFNHSSSLTDVTITAAAKDAEKGIAEDTTITVGGTGMTTTLAGALTTEGQVTLAGTLATDDLTAVNNSGTLTIDAEEVTLAGLNNTGTVTVTGNVELTSATTTGGELSAADVTLTGANTFSKLTATGTVTSDDTLTVGDGSDMAAVSEGTQLTTTGDVNIGSEASLAALSNAGNTLTVDGALTLTAATTAGGSVVADSLSLTGVNTFETLTLTGAVTLDTASYTSVGLTAAGVTGNSLALVVDETTIVSAIGASSNALTLANVTGLTSATINGESSFTSGSREYTLSVTEGLVQITATVTNEVVWEGTAGEVWGDASAWESGTEPTADSNVMFNDKGIDDVKIGGTAVANSVIVESSKNFITDASGTVEAHSLEINSGTLSIGEDVAVVISGKDEAKGNTAVSGDGNIIIKGALETDVLAAASKDVQLSGSLTIKDSALIGSIGGITEGQDTAYGDLTVGDEIATTAEGDPVAGKVTLAEDSTVQNLTVTSTGDLTAEKKLTVLGDMLNVGSTTVKGDLTQGEEDTDTDTLTNSGTLNVTGTLTSENLVTESGSTLQAANLAADTLNTEGDITVTGTTTVSGDLTATGGEMRTNKLTMDGESATLDVSGAGTIVAVGGSSSVDIDSVKVTNGGLFSSQSGNITADTITVSDAGSTLSANNKNATITADSVSVKNGGAIQSDAGAALTSSIKTDSLTIDGADSVVKIKAVNAKTAGSTTTVEVTNGGALAATNTVKATNVTVTGANSSLTAGGSDTVTGVDATTLKVQEGASFSATSAKATNATVDGTGTTATIGYGGLTTEETLTVTNGATLQGAVGDGNEGGDINAKTLVVGSGSSVKTTSTTGDPGNITVEKLEVASTGSVAAAGTLKVTDEIIGTAGEITADTLDLSGLTAAAAIADLKADTITLAGFDMLKVTDALTDKAGTGLAQVVLSLDAATLSSLTVGEELTVIDTTDSFTLTNLGAINTALKAYGLKGEMVESGGKLVMQIQDNSFLSQLGTTKNGLAGLGMADHAAAVGVDPKGDLAGILAHLDDLRTAGTEEAAKAGDKIGAALSGASAAAMGLALSGDVDRQLKAIRNRTTVMGVNQAVVNEGLPYINAWVNAEGDYSDIKADGTLPGYKLNSWGGTVGFDVDCTPTFTCGLAATAMYGDFDANSADKATGDLNTYYVSAFGRIASHRWTHTFVATAGMADTTLNRTVDGVKTKGESDGMMFGGMYEVGYVFALDKEATTCLQPIFNVSYTHTTLNGYQEKGSDVALSVGDVELNKLTVGLGARLQSVIGENIYNRSSLVEARALVKFHAGDRQGEVSNAFVKYAGSADAKSVETGAIGGEFGVGLTVPVGAEGGNIFMDASAEIRAEYINVNGTVGYRVNF